MRRTGDSEREESIQGGKVELREDMEWEKIWGRRTESDVIPPALVGLGYVHSLARLIAWLIAGNMTCIQPSLTDNAPQGLNDSPSASPLATKVGLSFHTPFTLPGMMFLFRS